ncbi:glycosyltransferase [Anaeromyxobacter sp. Red801]|uniref:glycosyltransferase n=1 Tax=Anaeromyxobacter sp. Red801 TaxID=3411632 RepID=UPI003BA14B1D
MPIALEREPRQPDTLPDPDAPEADRLPEELAAARAVAERERRRAEALEERLRAVEGALHDVEASRAWRAALLYYRVRDAVPAVAWARRAARALRRSVRARPGAGGPERAPARLPAAGGAGPLAGMTLGHRGRVSVVLPVFDQADLLPAAIESVLAQTHRDLELVVVNDGSRDGVERVLDRYADHPRVVVLTQPNQKLPSALNSGFAVATGEWFTWTSADNLMLPNQLEVLVARLRARPDLAMVYSDYQAIDGEDRPLRDPAFRPQDQDPRDPSRMRLPREVTTENLLRSGDNFIGASFLYRRDAARLLGPYAEDTFGGEDYDYWLRMHALFAIGHVDEVLYRYRVHANSLNARARALRIADAVDRLRARHEARLAALAAPPAWRCIGLAVPGVRLAGPGEPCDVSAHLLSRRDDPAVEEAARRPEVLRVCVVDLPLDALEREALAPYDLLLTREPGAQALASRWFPERAFLLDPSAAAPLLARVAAYRLFEKRRVPAPRHPPARVYPVASPLRVGLQAEGLDRGGLEQVVADLALNLPRERVRATVLVHARAPGAIGARLREAGVDLVITGGDERRLARAVEERKLQVMSLHYSVAGARDLARRGLASVYTAHNAYVWMEGAERARRAAALRGMDLVVAVSTPVERYVEEVFGVDARRLRVIPNGLDPRGLDAPPASRAALGMRDGDVAFVQVGRFAREKLQGVTLEAFRRIAGGLPTAHLVLAGAPADAGYAAEVTAAIRRAGLEDRVHLVHRAGRAEVAGLLRIADCLVQPSLVEGWSVAVMEAMYHGVPLVLTDVGSAREVVRGGIGLVLPNPYPRLAALDLAELRALARSYPEANLAALAEAMREVALRRDAWRARAAAGRARVLGELDVATMARAYADAFEDAWRRARKPAAR